MARIYYIEDVIFMLAQSVKEYMKMLSRPVFCKLIYSDPHPPYPRTQQHPFLIVIPFFILFLLVTFCF